MAARVTVLAGRVGAGKTAELLRRIRAAVQEGKQALLLVPEQYTYDAERMLLETLGGAAFYAEALGFSRLCERVLEEAGGGARLFLSPEGRRMALRGVLDEKRGSLKLYGGVSARSGFLERAGDLIDVFKAADLPPEALFSAAERVKDPLLCEKLRELGTIYGGLQERMAGRYADAADKLRLLTEKLPQCASLKETAVFVHSPHAFLFDARFYAIFAALVQAAGSVTMTLRLDERGDPLFAAEERALGFLRAIAPVAVEFVAGKEARPGALCVVEAQLFSAAPAAAQEEAGGVTLCRAPTPAAEAEAAAEHVFLLLESGARLSECYVAAADSALYAPLLRAALERRGIPLFLDGRRPLSSHPAVDFLLASLAAALRRFGKRDVLRAAKSGFSGLSADEADALEEYCLRFGVDRTPFLFPFERGRDRRPRLLHTAEEARKKLLPPLQALSEALEEAKTAKDFCRALYGHMLASALWEQLEAQAKRLRAQGRNDLAEETLQVYRAILELLDQIAELLDGPMTAARFYQVLDEGFAARTIGVLPPTADALSFGDVQTASGRRIGHLLLLGANEGCFPPPDTDGGVLNDRDAALLKEAGLDLFSDRAGRMLHERHLCYALLARPQKSLYASCAQSDDEGRPLQSAPLFDALCAMFPTAEQEVAPPPFLRPIDPEEGFAELLAALRTLVDTGGESLPEGLQAAYAAYSADPRYAGRLREAEARLFEQPGLGREEAKALYGPFQGSTVTRLEQFSRCPFAFLVSQGLCPDERRAYEETPGDAGTFYHDAFCAFFRTARERGLWNESLTDEVAGALLDEIAEALRATHNSGLLADGAQNRRTFELMRRTAKRTVLAMLKQLRAGEFLPYACEAAVGGDLPAVELALSNGAKAELIGRIDRVDLCKTADVPYVRILDYKTGNKTFSYAELESGLQLQLPLYLAACAGLGRPAGMFYLHIDDPIAEEGDGLLEEKRFRLRGVVLGELDALRAMDGESQGFSAFLPVRFTKEGASGTAQGALLTEEEMAFLCGCAKEIAAGVVERILEGESAPRPAQLGLWKACDWCPYRAICRFEPDRGDVYRLVPAVGAKEFFAQCGERGEEAHEV